MRKLTMALTATASLLAVTLAHKVDVTSAAGTTSPGELPLSDCLDLVGTYLTKNFAKSASDEAFTSRSLLSFTNGGHTFFTDSGEAKERGYGPFSDGRGAWRCVADEKGATKALATVLDFTFPTQSNPKQQIARLNFEARYDAQTKMIGGTIKLYFVPITGDPLKADSLHDGDAFKFTGLRVEAP